MSDRTDFDAAYEAGTHQDIVTELIHGVPHILVPAGADVKSAEKLLPAPTRIKASPEFHSIDGFVDYTGEFKQGGSRVFVDRWGLRFFTVFDSHAPGAPAWGDHCASLTLRLAPEWKRVVGIDGVRMTPEELAEWLEENLAYVHGPLAGTKLLDMVQNLKVDLKGELSVQSTTQSGLRHLSIRDDHVLNGKSGDKSMSFPEKIELRLRIYENCDAYAVNAFLRYRIGKEGIVFWFKVVDIPGTEEEAFDVCVDDVRNRTGLTTLHGKYNGPSHK